jgi:hypothetical protein
MLLVNGWNRLYPSHLLGGVGVHRLHGQDAVGLTTISIVS